MSSCCVGVALYQTISERDCSFVCVSEHTSAAESAVTAHRHTHATESHKMLNVTYNVEEVETWKFNCTVNTVVT